MYHLAVSEHPVDKFYLKLVSWTQLTFRKQKVEYAEILYDCIDITKFYNYMFNFP